MKKIYAATLLLLALILTAAIYFITGPNAHQSFSSNKSPLLEKMEIIETYPSVVSESDITEEYNLWLKAQISKSYYDALAKPLKDNEIPADKITIKAFGGNYSAGHPLGDPAGQNTDVQLPMLFSKDIYFAPLYAAPLTDEEFLTNPKISTEQIDFQTQFYFQISKDDRVATIYIHLQSGIKPKGLNKIISVSVVHQKNDTSIDSRTLPPFPY